MKIDLKAVIMGLEGKPINSTKEVFVIRKNDKGEDEFEKDAAGNPLVLVIPTPEKSLTLKEVLVNSLLASTAEKSTTEEKSKRFSLFFRIESSKADKIDFSSEEISLCKKLVQEAYPILTAGRACMILENK